MSSPAWDVIVVGAGFAGLSCATALAERGAKVLVLERRKHAGGRARSYADPKTGEPVDNGQHLFMGCYRETGRFLERIGTADLLRLESMPIAFYGPEGRAEFRLRRLPRLLSAAVAFLGFGAMPIPDRLRSLRLAWRARRCSVRPISSSLTAEEGGEDRISVREWLNRNGITPRGQARFWDLLAVAILNEDPETAAASALAASLSEIFSSPANARIGLARVPLSELYVDPAGRYLRERKGMLRADAPAARLEGTPDRVVGVRLADGKLLEADRYILAVPPADAARLWPHGPSGWETLRSSSILSLNLWIQEELFPSPFAGLLDSTFQWAFDRRKIWEGRGSHLCLVISGAGPLVKVSQQSLLATALADLERCFGRKPRIRRATIHREIFATVSHEAAPGPDLEKLKPRGPLASNLWAIGGWAWPGLPDTIESACRSGHHCADLLTTAG